MGGSADTPPLLVSTIDPFDDDFVAERCLI
jgi:hypothetical protein